MSNVGEAILAAAMAASDANPDQRHMGEVRLQQLKANPQEFFAACATLFVDPAVPIRGRQLAGLMIKNHLFHPMCVQNATLEQCVLQRGVVDPEHAIRAVACTIISTAVRDLHWAVESTVHALVQILTSRHGEAHAVHGAMRALSQITDDCVQLLDMRQLTGNVVVAVLPYLNAPLPGQQGIEVRLRALDCVAVVLEQAGVDSQSFSFASMQPHVLGVVEACFANLRNPASSKLAALCVKCIVLSLTYHTAISDALFNHMVELMITVTASNPDGDDEELRIEATEFWRGLLCFPRFTQLVQPAIPNVIPLLIRSMVYSNLEIGMLQVSADDWQVPDKIDDIRPRHYEAQVRKNASAAAAGDGNNNNNNGDDEDDDDDDDGEVQEWNLRRVSALTLDAISEYYGEKILVPVLTVIDGMMQPGQEWKKTEAAVLAIGAIADGCLNSMEPYLPAIAERLLTLLKDTSVHFLVGTISLWTMTQIGRFIIRDNKVLHEFLMCILSKMQSPSKLVQEAGTDALETMVEMCTDGQLENSVSDIISTIAKCLGGFQLKNRVRLLETLEKVCETLGEQLRVSPDAIETLMRPLGTIWDETPNDSPMLFSCFKCMASVCYALGPAIGPMAQNIFERSYGVLLAHVHIRTAALQANQDPPDYEFIVTSSNLLSGLFDALGTTLEPLVTQCQPPLTQIALGIVNDTNEDIRQSGFALLADVVKSFPAQVQQVLGLVIAACVKNLQEFNENTVDVISNVAWFLSHLLENQMGGQNLPMLGQENGLLDVLASVCAILGSGRLTADMRCMAENLCICLGMIFYTNPELAVNPHCSIAAVAKPFCEYMRNVRDATHQYEAVSGFLLAMQRNMPVVIASAHLFFDLALSLTSAGQETQRQMSEQLNAMKAQSGANWQQIMMQYNAQTRTRLYHVYGIQ